MPFTENLCSHVNELLDEKNGAIICSDCGLVLDDKIFTSALSPVLSYECENNSAEKNEVKELLEKMHLPKSFTSFIIHQIPKNPKPHSTCKDIPYIIYKTLNELGNPISINDIANVTGVSHKNITKKQQNSTSLILEPRQLLEKYCNLLGLTYKQYTVIKEKLRQSNIISGHNPLTIIASLIYLYCKENNLHYSMKSVASVVGISCVSIQRYLKTNNELSFRT